MFSMCIDEYCLSPPPFAEFTSRSVSRTCQSLLENTHWSIAWSMCLHAGVYTVLPYVSADVNVDVHVSAFVCACLGRVVKSFTMAHANQGRRNWCNCAGRMSLCLPSLQRCSLAAKATPATWRTKQDVSILLVLVRMVPSILVLRTPVSR